MQYIVDNKRRLIYNFWDEMEDYAMKNYKIRPIITKNDKDDNTLLFVAQKLQKYLSKVSEN